MLPSQVELDAVFRSHRHRGRKVAVDASFIVEHYEEQDGGRVSGCSVFEVTVPTQYEPKRWIIRVLHRRPIAANKDENIVPAQELSTRLVETAREFARAAIDARIYPERAFSR